MLDSGFYFRDLLPHSNELQFCYNLIEVTPDRNSQPIVEELAFLLVGRVGLEPTRPLKATGLQPATLPITLYLPIIAVWLTCTFLLTAQELSRLLVGSQSDAGNFRTAISHHASLLSVKRGSGISPQSFFPNNMEQDNRPNPWSRHGDSNPESPP